MSKKQSGKFVLRLNPELHSELKDSAGRGNQSLNELCVQRLALPESWWIIPEFRRLIAHAHKVHRRDLVAVVLFGSVSRRTETLSSDADLLIVLESQCKVTRDSYHPWADNEFRLGHHLVETTIRALPEEQKPDGFWAEIAVEGIILWSSTLKLHYYLSSLRRKIADGKLRREKSYGHSYWVFQEDAA